jgi:acetyl esterase/lipase
MLSARLILSALILGITMICTSGSLYAAGEVTVEHGVRIVRDIQYSHANERLKLDIYEPEEFAGRLPVIVMIHGGGWVSADKSAYGGTAIEFARRGFAVACINYRYSTQALFPAQIIDCKTAIRWLRANADRYHFDKARFAAMGNSAGGHLVALLGTSSGVKDFESAECKGERDDVQAVADFFGVADFVTGAQTPGYEALWNDPHQGFSMLIGGPIVHNKEKAKHASPVTYVSRKSAPFIIFHGDKDTLVPIRQATEMRDALKRVGVDAELHVLKGVGHGGAEFLVPQINDQIQTFLTKKLKIRAAGH